MALMVFFVCMCVAGNIRKRKWKPGICLGLGEDNYIILGLVVLGWIGGAVKTPCQSLGDG